MLLFGHRSSERVGQFTLQHPFARRVLQVGRMKSVQLNAFVCRHRKHHIRRPYAGAGSMRGMTLEHRPIVGENPKGSLLRI